MKSIINRPTLVLLIGMVVTLLSAQSPQLSVDGEVEQSVYGISDFHNNNLGLLTTGGPGNWTFQSGELVSPGLNQGEYLEYIVVVPEGSIKKIYFNLRFESLEDYVVAVKINGLTSHHINPNLHYKTYGQITLPEGSHTIKWFLDGNTSSKVFFNSAYTITLSNFALQINDGTQGDGKILTSGPNGEAYWGDISTILFDQPKYQIGESAQGGIIFYLDKTGEHGLATIGYDLNPGVQWFNGSYETFQRKKTKSCTVVIEIQAS